jgi:hypothetical protein
MAYASFDTSELDALARDLGTVPSEVRRIGKATVEFHARQLRDTWRRNAWETGGRRTGPEQRWLEYPPAKWTGDECSTTVRPRPGSPQAYLSVGDELGSVNTPPHLNAARAVDGQVGKFVEAVRQFVGYEPLARGV